MKATSGRWMKAGAALIAAVGFLAGVHSATAQATQTIDARELKAILEAVLFVSPEPVPVARLMAILGTVSKAEVVQALGILTHDLEIVF